MEEGQIIEIVQNDEYMRVVPVIGYYLKSKNISCIFKSKTPTFATTKMGEYIYSVTPSNTSAPSP